MPAELRLFKDAYVDSVVQLSGTRAMYAVDGIRWAAAAMATPTNLDTLRSEGFQPPAAGANDLFVAASADEDDAVKAALEAAEQAIFAARRPAGEAPAHTARSLREAVQQQPGSNVAVISVPGEYAPLEAHKALSAGLDVLLFSDNVPVEAEIELKDRARRLGRLIMGPGAGTAMLAGTGLGFANVVRPGRVGVVAAAGTGAQEAMSLLDRWGVGVACVIGLGGRDLSAAVAGRTAVQAVESLRHDDRVDAILLVSKPPADAVARAVLEAAADTPLVAAYVGTTAVFELPPTAQVATTLEGGVLRMLDTVGVARPDVTGTLEADVAAAVERLGSGRRLVRGLYSGGTLCYESLTILGALLGDVYSNTPLDKRLAAPAPPGAHVCLDLGEEEYTKGRPHPMIDPEARIELLREQGEDPAVAAILLDVVLGHGSHADPAGRLAPACAAIHRAGGPQVVAYVLGTHGDPQGFDAQRATLRDAGCVVTETAARACFAAAAIATRQPSVVRQTW